MTTSIPELSSYYFDLHQRMRPDIRMAFEKPRASWDESDGTSHFRWFLEFGDLVIRNPYGREALCTVVLVISAVVMVIVWFFMQPWHFHRTLAQACRITGSVGALFLGLALRAQQREHTKPGWCGQCWQWYPPPDH